MRTAPIVGPCEASFDETRVNLDSALAYADANKSDVAKNIEDIEAAIARIRHRRHDLMLLQVLDRQELRFDLDDPSPFEGLEGEGRMNVDPRVVREDYLAAIEAHCGTIEKSARSHGYDYLRLDTHASVGPAIAAKIGRHKAVAEEARSHAIQGGATVLPPLGGPAVAQALPNATNRFRAQPLKSLTLEALLTNQSDPSLYANSVPAKLGEVHAFMSHSWNDDGTLKYNKLHADPKQGKTLDIVMKKVKHKMVENMTSSTADALGLSRYIFTFIRLEYQLLSSCHQIIVKQLFTVR